MVSLFSSIGKTDCGTIGLLAVECSRMSQIANTKCLWNSTFLLYLKIMLTSNNLSYMRFCHLYSILYWSDIELIRNAENARVDWSSTNSHRRKLQPFFSTNHTNLPLEICNPVAPLEGRKDHRKGSFQQIFHALLENKLRSCQTDPLFDVESNALWWMLPSLYPWGWTLALLCCGDFACTEPQL